MNDLIRIDYGRDEPTVSARELHEFLEVGTRFIDWFTRMCGYGFNEGVDFNLLKFEKVQTEGSREVKRDIIDSRLEAANRSAAVTAARPIELER
jgi:anti-repressor protein